MKKTIKLKIINSIFLILVFFTSFSCFKEMPERGLQITIPGNHPVQNLQTLLRDEEKTKILLLGVPPLNVLRSDFSPVLLDNIINKLLQFNPDVICIDAISPKEIEYTYDEGLSLLEFSEEDISNSLKLRNKFKLSFQNISEKIDSILNNSENDFNLPRKEQLIELYISNFDYYSAALIFRYLTDEEIKNIKLDKAIINRLKSIINQSDEKSSIGLRLANQLKLHRVYPIGDFSDRYKLNKISEQLYNEMILSEVYNSKRFEILDQTADNKLKEGLNKNDLLEFFNYINSDSYALTSTKNNWSIYYKMFLDSGLDRTRVGLWEMKNMRIASNIREVSADYPTKKILVIIDVSKKPFVEEYLKSTTDIKLIKFTDIGN